MGASLLSCELGRTKSTKGKRHDWSRGVITNFSKQSRRRILRLVASLKRAMKPLFGTLTYPDIFSPDPKIWKRDLATLWKRLLRQYPKAIVIWRLERKDRKTGENKGAIAPHFHLLIYNVPYLVMLAWLPLAWYEIVGSHDPRHLAVLRGKAGNGNKPCVEEVHSVRGVLHYTAKYICKAENLDLDGIGRMWGIVGRAELPGIQGAFEVVEIDPRTALTVLRYMRRKASEVYRKGKYRGRRKIPGWGIKFTLIGDSEFWYKALPKIRDLGSSNNAIAPEVSKYES
jgi:hypothetical protein